tara:strand:+ start:445 stop:630 length:186 start_codon:yes stop_codon:yes gene_type:complete
MKTLSEEKLSELVLKNVLAWSEEEFQANDDDLTLNDRFNENLESFIDLLKEEILESSEDLT